MKGWWLLFTKTMSLKDRDFVQEKEETEIFLRFN